jgi:hypothetical protein
MKSLCLPFLALFLAWDLAEARPDESISLSGVWRLALDPRDEGLKGGPDTVRFDDTISLPNTLTTAGKGEPLTLVPALNKEVLASLHQRYSYLGPAWYQRDFEVPADWSGKDVELELERVLWESRLWVNGKGAGLQDSLSTPHRYDLSGLIKPGKNTLTLRIDNREKLPIGVGHAYTNATQTIWNGVVGNLELRARPKVRISTLHLRSGEGGKMVARIAATNGGEKAVSARYQLDVIHPDGRRMPPLSFSRTIPAWTSDHEVTVELGPQRAEWSEAEPLLYRVEAQVTSDSGESAAASTFGYRRFEAKGRDLLINGRPVFLRGTLECCIFPKTGHPDMTGREWEKIFATAREHGLNHLRFHSWCPPRVAFEKADEHGFYLQVELPNWSFYMGHRPAVDEFFSLEGERILREYGNHPSFVMMCLGNELTGDYAAMDRMVGHFRELDPDKLYSSTAFSFSERGQKAGPEDDFFISQQTSSGWVRGQGFLNQTQPNTDSDYAAGLASVEVPLVTHEVGQYNNYPNLAELPKYEGGALRALGYEAIREDLRKKGRLEDAPRLTRDSGKLAALLYKEDMERALRTKDLAGIQLLDLHDFPGQSTATVGLLDAFWDSKGLIKPEDFREFCSPSVPLARMAKMVWENRETFEADLEIAHFGKAPLRDAVVTWRLINGENKEHAAGRIKVASIPLGNGIRLGKVSAPLAGIESASKLALIVAIEGTDIRNSWPLWVYPTAGASEPADVEIFKSPGPELMAALKAGKRVLMLPERAALAGPLDARFIPVFWSPLHFPNQPGTLGASIDPDHPVFAAFPTDTHTNWQWWELFSVSYAMDLNGLVTKPTIPLSFVDKFDRNALPAAIWEARVGKGRLLVCTLDIEGSLDRRIAARQLRRSILDYMASDHFQPEVELLAEHLAPLFKEIRFRAHADNADPNHTAQSAVDGDPATFWHTEWQSGAVRLPATLGIDLGKPARIVGFTYRPRPDMNRGRISRFRIEVSDDGKIWRQAQAEAVFPDNAEPQVVRFTKEMVARQIRLVTLADHGASQQAAVAEFEPLIDAGADTRGLGIVPGFNDGSK